MTCHSSSALHPPSPQNLALLWCFFCHLRDRGIFLHLGLSHLDSLTSFGTYALRLSSKDPRVLVVDYVTAEGGLESLQISVGFGAIGGEPLVEFYPGDGVRGDILFAISHFRRAKYPLLTPLSPFSLSQQPNGQKRQMTKYKTRVKNGVVGGRTTMSRFTQKVAQPEPYGDTPDPPSIYPM